MDKLALATAVVLAVGLCAFAEQEPEREPVWPEGRMPGPQTNVVNYAPYYMWWTPTNQTTDAIMICCSGGGYHGCGTGGFETRPLVHYLNDKGMNVVEFRYRCPRIDKVLGPKHLLAWQDAQRVIRIVRHEARKRGLCPDKIGFSGCSAGGHLTIMAAVSSTTNAYELIGDEIDKASCRLNFAVPVYPAYGMSDVPDAPAPSLDLAIPLVPEFLFDNQTPPMCFFHGDDDDWTPMTSMRCWHKLHAMRVPAELHILTQEAHAFQYRPKPNTNADCWKDTLWNWLTRLDIVTGHPYRWYCRSATFIGKGWQYPVRHMAMTNAFDYAEGSWLGDGMGGGFFPVKPGEDIAIRKPAPTNCEFDVEIQIFKGAATGVVIGGTEIAIPANYCPDGQVCRLTVRRENGAVASALLCGKPVPAEWLKPVPGNAPDRIVFRGKKEGEAGYGRFRDPLWRDL